MCRLILARIQGDTMKALITAGGRGTRLGAMTHKSNKHLIPVANKPMIHYAIEAMAGSGIHDIGISINPDTGAALQTTLGDGKAWGVRCQGDHRRSGTPMCSGVAQCRVASGRGTSRV